MKLMHPSQGQVFKGIATRSISQVRQQGCRSHQLQPLPEDTLLLQEAVNDAAGEVEGLRQQLQATANMRLIASSHRCQLALTLPSRLPAALEQAVPDALRGQGAIGAGCTAARTQAHAQQASSQAL